MRNRACSGTWSVLRTESVEYSECFFGGKKSNMCCDQALKKKYYLQEKIEIGLLFKVQYKC